MPQTRCVADVEFNVGKQTTLDMSVTAMTTATLKNEFVSVGIFALKVLFLFVEVHFLS